MSKQNIIVVHIRHYKNKAEPSMFYALVANPDSADPSWTSNEKSAFVFNEKNHLLYTQFRKQILKGSDLKYTFNVIKEEVVWKLTDLPETKHESNGWRKEYVKP